MVNVPLTSALRKQYQDRFDSCVIRPERAAEVERLVDGLAANRARYEAVSAHMGIPWHFVAVIHNMESSQSFRGHLHNGDPLTARTVQVPKGRPKTGGPPFTWEVSAADALAIKGLSAATDWSLAGTLYQAERFNGMGYLAFHPGVPSPYLWSFSTHYARGKYVSDGTWSDTAVSKQCGAAVLLRRMAERGLAVFADQVPPPADAAPMVTHFTNIKPTDPQVLARGMALQTWLNTHTGIFLRVDGATGEKTSDAYRKVTGHFLPGDPRG